MLSCCTLNAWAQAAMEPPCPQVVSMQLGARVQPCTHETVPTPGGPMWPHATWGSMHPDGQRNAWQVDGQWIRLHGVICKAGRMPSGLIEVCSSGGRLRGE